MKQVKILEFDGKFLLPIKGQAVGRCIVDQAFALEFFQDNEICAIKIEGDFTISAARRVSKCSPSEPSGLGPATALFGKTVSSAVVLTNGELELEFGDGTVLSVVPDSEFEAWGFSGVGGSMAVCAPGGRVSVWQPQDQ